MSVSGFLLYDKPACRTSFDSLSEFKRSDSTTKFGHAGTLDRFATGLLIVLAGSYVRLTPWFQGLDKDYRAEVCFGTQTDTLDADGTVVMTEQPPSREVLEICIPRFLGIQDQTPPEYSAVHYNGARASSLARKGIHPKLQARQVEITRLDLVQYDGQRATLDITCSSGTYVRALARDLAAACGSCAHVSALERTRVGPFYLDSVRHGVTSFRSMASASENLPVWEKLSVHTALRLGLQVGFIPSPYEEQFVHGFPGALGFIRLDADNSPNSHNLADPKAELAVFSEAGSFLGIVEKTSQGYRYKVVL